MLSSGLICDRIRCQITELYIKHTVVSINVKCKQVFRGSGQLFSSCFRPSGETLTVCWLENFSNLQLFYFFLLHKSPTCFLIFFLWPLQKGPLVSLSAWSGPCLFTGRFTLKRPGRHPRVPARSPKLLPSLKTFPHICAVRARHVHLYLCAVWAAMRRKGKHVLVLSLGHMFWSRCGKINSHKHVKVQWCA